MLMTRQSKFFMFITSESITKCNLYRVVSHIHAGGYGKGFVRDNGVLLHAVNVCCID